MDPSPPTGDPDRLYERVLVLRVQTGDEAAFAELVGRYHPRLRYYVRKMTGDADAADDVLQDVWLDAFRGLGRLADPGAFAAWLYRIARRRAGRTARQWKPAGPLPDEVAAEPDDEPFGPDDAGRVHAALDRLAPAHREILVLRFIEGMSYDGIAAVVGCPPGTVRSRLHHAKRALRGVLEPEVLP